MKGNPYHYEHKNMRKNSIFYLTPFEQKTRTELVFRGVKILAQKTINIWQLALAEHLDRVDLHRKAELVRRARRWEECPRGRRAYIYPTWTIGEYFHTQYLYQWLTAILQAMRKPKSFYQFRMKIGEVDLIHDRQIRFRVEKGHRAWRSFRRCRRKEVAMLASWSFDIYRHNLYLILSILTFDKVDNRDRYFKTLRKYGFYPATPVNCIRGSARKKITRLLYAPYTFLEDYDKAKMAAYMNKFFRHRDWFLLIGFDEYQKDEIQDRLWHYLRDLYKQKKVAKTKKRGADGTKRSFRRKQEVEGIKW